MEARDRIAAIGLIALKYLDPDNAYRRQLAAWYDEGLQNEPKIGRVPMREGCLPSRHLYQVLVPSRDETILALNDEKIYPGVHYRDNTLYKMYSYAKGSAPRSLEASEHIISLPMLLRLSYRDVQRICNALKEITARK